MVRGPIIGAVIRLSCSIQASASLQSRPSCASKSYPPEDRMSRIEARINDYLAMGVPYVWVLDPETRQAYIATPAEGLREVKSGVLRTENPVLELPLAEMFA